MKNITFKSIFILIVSILILGCKDKTRNMYTRINSDGTIYREFVENGDSSFMVGDTSKNYPFLVNIDSSWIVSYSYGHDSMPAKFITGWPLKEFKNKIDSVHHVKIKLSKTYRDLNELTSTFTFERLLWYPKIKQDFKLNKRFRWFYTYFDYTEIFKKMNPNPQTKISDFLTEEEISHYFGENNDFTKGRNGIESLNYLQNMEGRAEKWISRCIYDAYFKVLLKNYHLFGAIKMDSIRFKSLKDSIFIELGDHNKFNKDSAFFVDMDNYFKTDVFSKVYLKNDSLKEEINYAGGVIETYLDCPGELYYGLSMPGKIIETNSAIRYSDTLTWKVNADRFFFNDYKIYAKSRKPNYWAFAVTGIIVLLGALSFWIKRK